MTARPSDTDHYVRRPVARGDADVLLWRVNGALVEASRTDDVRLHVQDGAEAHCPDCPDGAALWQSGPGGALECRDCGAEFVPATRCPLYVPGLPLPPPLTPRMTCVECGAEVPEEIECAECGAEQGP